jgi:hypothetical protein
MRWAGTYTFRDAGMSFLEVRFALLTGFRLLPMMVLKTGRMLVEWNVNQVWLTRFSSPLGTRDTTIVCCFIM